MILNSSVYEILKANLGIEFLCKSRALVKMFFLLVLFLFCGFNKVSCEPKK